jgi:hypothetical protein
MDGERMDPGLEFTRQRRVDHAVAFEPALSPECVRYDIEAEVRLAARPMPGMPRMQMGFVFNVQALGRERRNELGRDNVLHSHCEARCRQRCRLRDNKILGVPTRGADLPSVKS